MNRYYVPGIVFLFSLLQLQAMQQVVEAPSITGRIYIDGPVAYGPAKYYRHLNNTLCTKVELFEPLIQVGVVIDDKDDNNKVIESRWTNNDSNYVSKRRHEVVPNEKQTPIPHIIETLEKQWWARSCNTDNLDTDVIHEIKAKYFPNYLPVRFFKNAAENNGQLTLSVYTYTALLQLICNPNCNISDQINEFITAPRYFKWKVKGLEVTPILELMKKKFIKKTFIPHDGELTLCHKDTRLCSRYCNLDPYNYEHGTEGIKTVEQLKLEFGRVLAALTGKVILWPSPAKVKEEKKEENIEKRQTQIWPQYPLAVQNFGY